MTARHKPYIISTYLTSALSPAKARKLVKACVDALKPHKDEFDSIAFRGISGALIAPLVAQRLGKPLIAVRKPGAAESHHSSYQVEGNIATQSYVIIDDLISTGRTVKEIIEAIQTAQAECCDWTTGKPKYPPGRCYAVVLYLTEAGIISGRQDWPYLPLILGVRPENII